MRKDPPFDMEYIYTTYILERAEEQGVLVVNRPQGLRDMNEKVFTAWFPQCCAPTLITRDMADMHAFLREHLRIVCKPLYGMGGRSIFVVDRGDKNANVVFETHDRVRHALRDRAEVHSRHRGHRRLAHPGHRRRARAVRAGAHPARNPTTAATSPPARAARAASSTSATAGWSSQIGPTLRQRGMLFVGLDVIGGYVTEINVTSPTGVRELDKQFGTEIAGLLMDAIEKRIDVMNAAAPETAPLPIDVREGSAPVKDRMTTTLFLAALFHGIVILGVTFAVPMLEKQPAASIEVLL